MNPRNRNKNVLLIVLVGITVLVVANLFSAEDPTRREWTYDEFLNHVRQGQVREVTIRGAEILGQANSGERFLAIAPPDERLVERLETHNVRIQARPGNERPWYLSLFLQWLPLICIVGVWIFLMRRMQGGNSRLFSLGRNRARRVDEQEATVTFADVAGVEEAKEELTEIIAFLKSPQKFRRLGGRIPRGVLMVGPPGTGKTLLARAVAGEAEVPFFSISGSDFVEMFVGVGASRVRDLFADGRKNSPCILFIDEIDAVGRKRGAGLGSGHDEREQTLNQLLVEMDGFEHSDEVIVMAATNRPDVLDPALLRPGRFDRQVVVSLPDLRGRERILRIHAGKVKLAEGISLEVIARGTPGFSGADLRNVVNEAALYAARERKEQVELEDLEWARDKVMMGPERRSMFITEDQKRNTAYHEAGHALVGALLEHTDPVHRITIIPRGQALGLTAFLPKEDAHNHSRKYLVNRIAVAMGGRAAEELIFGETSTGASNDIQQATDTARNMVTRYGMSESLGPITLASGEEQHFLGRDIGMEREYSEEVAEIIDSEVQSLLIGGYQKAKQVLQTHLKLLHSLANQLIEQETVEGEALRQMIGGEMIGTEPSS